MTRTHIPVLAGELIDVLDPRPGEIAVDCTVGGGGHARLIAERIGPAGTLIGIDRDPVAEERFAALAAEVPCETRFIRADFVTALAELEQERLRADLVYLDLGMSSMQVDTWARGFSYSYDAPLDMRMDPDQALTAQEIVNTWEERRLARLLREYGEERYAGPIARGIARARRREELRSTQQLVETIKAAVPVPAQFAGGHPARRTFQALRVAVNDEFAQLDSALPEAWDLLAVGGRMAAISFHSLEDRLVKRFFSARARGCICPPELPICVCGHEPEAELLTRRAIAPTPGEVAANPRSKSAHLRAARKLEVPTT
jgi:16S rRNA (cytosine1402-N4)-methyltransferase